MLAAKTALPVIGVPIPTQHLGGLDSLLSIVQMPRGIPVATVAIGNATNAGLLAAAILALVGSRRSRRGSPRGGRARPRRVLDDPSNADRLDARRRGRAARHSVVADARGRQARGARAGGSRGPARS